MFRLGNFTIDEVLYLVAQKLGTDQILYTADELQSAQIEISAESTDITDKKGNVVRTKYRAKTGTFTSTSAMLHPALMNAASGSDMQNATDEAPIIMPRITIVTAGATIDISDYKEGTVKVIGLYGGGANGDALDDATVAGLISDGKFTAPAAGEDLPIQYLVKYERDVKSGIMLMNDAEKFPDAVKLTLSASYVDPCGELKACYIVLPRFVADPSTTIAFDAENQTMDFAGALNMDYCSSLGKVLYYIYFPETDDVSSGGGDEPITNPTVAAEAGDVSMFGTLVSDMQDNVVVSGNAITGTLKYLDSGALVDTWGAGNFIALKFTDLDPAATSVKVGLDPSQGSGLVEIIDDPDKNGAFKVTNKDTQVFKVVSTDGTNTKTTTYSLAGLTVLNS